MQSVQLSLLIVTAHIQIRLQKKKKGMLLTVMSMLNSFRCNLKILSFWLSDYYFMLVIRTVGYLERFKIHESNQTKFLNYSKLIIHI